MQKCSMEGEISPTSLLHNKLLLKHTQAAGPAQTEELASRQLEWLLHWHWLGYLQEEDQA